MSFSDSLNILAVDPGLQGALAVLQPDGKAQVFDPPIIKREGTKKSTGAKTYDIHALFDLVNNNRDSENNIFVIEKVMPQPGEGTVSSFHFGEGFGFWKMAAAAANMQVVEVRPQSWKKVYTELYEDSEIVEIKEQIKQLRADKKEAKGKKEKNRIEKEVKSLNRKLKTRAKDLSRDIAARMHPEIAEYFKLKKHDGRADALLIAEYINNNR